jgi:hypothetical protein
MQLARFACLVLAWLPGACLCGSSSSSIWLQAAGIWKVDVPGVSRVHPQPAHAMDNELLQAANCFHSFTLYRTCLHTHMQDAARRLTC